MRKLLDFLYSRRVVTIFIGLEVICAWLIVSFNQRHNVDFLNSSNVLAAQVSTTSENVSNYFELAEINEQLMEENELLQARLGSNKSGRLSVDTLNRFRVVGARVVNNTHRRSINFLTIAAGEKDGITPGMGVISAKGVVGQVKSVSHNFATIYSLLHPNVMISSSVKKTNTNCTVQWDQRKYNEASLRYVPRHINLQVGDSIVTSGFNAIFPQNISVGVVSELNLESHMTFYEASVSLSTDFTSLPNVFVIVDELKVERDSVETL